ncbi:unnamed protein product [Linum tenue]|uniref:Uncharacterized protein n=1 Tax=Linum tenue TaxID=586396 RepID=A0AAV0S0G8_9ROSI|nr:unnamed protein product [Linum tenue]
MEGLMKVIRGLKPRIVVVLEMESNHNLTTLSPRFVEELFSFASVLDCLEGRAAGVGATGSVQRRGSDRGREGRPHWGTRQQGLAQIGGKWRRGTALGKMAMATGHRRRVTGAGEDDDGDGERLGKTAMETGTATRRNGGDGDGERRRGGTAAMGFGVRKRRFLVSTKKKMEN